MEWPSAPDDAAFGTRAHPSIMPAFAGGDSRLESQVTILSVFQCKGLFCYVTEEVMPNTIQGKGAIHKEVYTMSPTTKREVLP
jgi:hypothetical protein